MRSSWKTTTIAILALALPAGALANISGTATLSVNTALNLDTGTTSSSGGDVLWTTAMTPQGKATAYNIPGSQGVSFYNNVTQSILAAFGPLYSSAQISGSLMIMNDVFAVKTNGGNYAAVLVTMVSGASLTVTFTTFGVNSGPTVTQVLNNYSYTPAGFPNSGIAPGSIFIIVGTGLADPTKTAILQDSTAGQLPSTLNGASVKVTSGGTTVTPAFYYAIATQLALVLPSNTPVGTAQITVTYNSQTSTPYTFQVMQSAFGFLSYSGTGSGLAAAINLSKGCCYNGASAIPPGTTIELYGSGLGADPKPARDTTFVAITSAAADSINALTHIYVGGVDAGPPAYQGASGFPGLNQLNITIPSNAPTGCNVALAGVTASGLVTNILTLPIGTGPCADPAYGTNGNQLLTLGSQTTVKTGAVEIIHTTAPATGGGTQVNDVAAASFQSYTGSSYATGNGLVSLGGCTINQSTSSTAVSGSLKGLDAGNIKVSSPAGSSVFLSSLPGVAGSSFAQLSPGFIPSTGGTFTFQGGGGADVGSFIASLTLPTPLLSWTNQTAASTVARSAGLPVMWTGGSSGSFVVISGSSVATASSVFGSFTCIAPVTAGQFTVPSYILSALPAGSGSVTVSNETNYTTFNATGIDLGISIGFVSFQANSTYN
jgi:uncharacterized protein (TIGR03437 family)